MNKSPSPARYLTVVLALLAVTFSLSLIVGCSTNAVAPSDTVNQSTLDWLNQNFSGEAAERAQVINLNNCPVLFDTTLSKLVDWRGCQIDMVHGTEKIGFSLPWMAVKTSITLTIRVRKYQAPFGHFWMLDCNPEGLVFNYPLYVQPNQAIANSSVVVLLYYNPKTKQWEVQQKAPNSNPQIPIYHFSKYGIT